MRPSETARFPAVGQFWARLSPLILTRIEVVGELEGGGPGCLSVYEWHPNGKGEGTLVSMGPEYRFLWYERIFDGLGSLPKPPVPGDVWHYPDHDRLIFVGPETDDKKVHVLADWDVKSAIWYSTVQMRLFQPGPGGRPGEDIRKTVYEHLREPSL